MNYNKELTAYIVEEYTANPSRDTVNNLAQEIGKPAKSIIGKLSREGVYRRAFYTTKSGENTVTKLELVSEIALNLDIPEDKLSGLEKSPKSALKLLVEMTQPS
jgi:hypothetical protein